MANKVISVATAAITGVSMISAVVNYNGDENFMDGEIGYYPLEIQLNELECFNVEANPNICIESMQFTCDVNTSQLPDYKAFCTQGILHYKDKNSLDVSRSFYDCVSVDEPAYSSVAGKEHVQTRYKIGSKTSPLNMYVNNPDSNMKLEFTWCTGTSLSVTDMEFTTTTGKCYKLSDDNLEIYKIAITEGDNISGSETHKSTETVFSPFGTEDFYISSIYGEYRGDWDTHWGIDMCSQGSYKVYATHSGYVEYSNWENPGDWSQGFGQYVKIVGDDGRWYYYGHMSELCVSEGDYVEAGTQVGVEGSTGYSTGDHLHYEIRLPEGGTDNPCDDMGCPNDYGMVYVSDYVDLSEKVEEAPSATPSSADSNFVPSAELIQKCISFNAYFEIGSGLANTMNLNDCGSASIGIIQCRGEFAKELVSYIRKSNPTYYDGLLKKYPGFIGLDADWEYFTIDEGSDDYYFLSDLLIQDWAVDAQWDFVSSHISQLLIRANDAGITNEDALILYTRCAINAGPWSNSVYWIEDHPNASTDEIFNNISITSLDKVRNVWVDHEWSIISANDKKA